MSIENSIKPRKIFEAPPISEEEEKAVQEMMTEKQQVLSEKREQELQRLTEIIDKVPVENDRQNFEELIAGCPAALKVKYLKALEGCLKNKDEVAKTTSMQGLFFELSRINSLMGQDLETVDFNLNAPPKIKYRGFSKGADFTHEPTEQLESKIDIDVPIERGGKPYVYEIKNYPRMEFGSQIGQRNQLLKYQAAIEQGSVDGATVELKGRIDRKFLKWAAGESIDDPGKIPDVEMIYTFDLPSGAEYRFVLKRGRKNNGLNFQNEGRSATPEATLNKLKEKEPERYKTLFDSFGSDEEILKKLEEDRKIINGIQRAVIDRSIVDIISSVNIENPPPELEPYLSDPMQIKSLDLYNQYEALRKKSINKQLLKKREIINVDNKKSAYSEYATPEYIEKSVREYQDYLRQNPEMAKVKKAYVLVSEEDIQKVVEKALSAIEKIANFELKRKISEEQVDDTARREMGYIGLPEGVALDIEHIIMDAIQDINKKKGQVGRSYEDPERFRKIEELAEYLPDQDRHYVEFTIYDPISGKSEKRTDASEAQISKTGNQLLIDNLKRAEQKINEFDSRAEELKGLTERTPEENSELTRLEGRLRAKNMHAKTVDSIKKAIEEIGSEKDSKLRNTNKELGELKKRQGELRKQGADTTEMTEAITQKIDELKSLSAEFDAAINQKRRDLASLFQQILGGKGEWEKIAKRISGKVEQNIIKFIYTVTSGGEIVVDEEVIRGEKTTGRAAHSELAQGKNVYGAGELAFSKENGKWSLTEINNGSGHYRPSVRTLAYVKNLLESKGVDTSRAELRDTLLRGVSLSDLTILEE